MSRYRVAMDQYGDTAQRLPRDAEFVDDVQIVRSSVTGWRAVILVDAKNRGEAITEARKRLGRFVAPGLYWHLLRAGDAPENQP